MEEPTGQEARRGVGFHSERVGPEVSVEYPVLLDKPVLPAYGSPALGGNSLLPPVMLQDARSASRR